MFEINPNPLKQQLTALIKLAKADMAHRFAEAHVDLTPLQYAVLLKLKDQSTTINELAKRFDVKAPSLVPVIDALEKDGLADRTADAQDRRKIQLSATKKGLELIKKIPIDDKHDILNSAFDKLDSVKQKQLLSLLKELTTNISK